MSDLPIIFFYSAIFSTPLCSSLPALEKCIRGDEYKVVMLQIIHSALPYSSIAYSTPRLLLTSLPLSSSHSLSHPLSFSLPFSHKQQSGQIAGQLKRADHLSTEYWKPATGAVEHNKSSSYEYTLSLTAEGAIHSVCMCVWASAIIWMQVR